MLLRCNLSWGRPVPSKLLLLLSNKGSSEALRLFLNKQLKGLRVLAVTNQFAFHDLCIDTFARGCTPGRSARLAQNYIAKVGYFQCL